MPSQELTAALKDARHLLRPPAPKRDPVWPALAAAAFFAASALLLATATILAPPVQSSPPTLALRGVG